MVLGSCDSFEEEKKHVNLLQRSSDYYRELSEKEDEGVDWIDNITNKQDGDTLFSSVSHLDNGCMEFDLDIEYLKDTIFLKYVQRNEENCKEIVVYKLGYKILNTEGKKYIIKLKEF
jgi:hypothetical protein